MTLLQLPAFITTIIFFCAWIHHPFAHPDSDLLHLLAIKSAIFIDPYNSTSSWNTTLHFCLWEGVTCTTRSTHPRVFSLSLPSRNLHGTLSPHVSNLTFLHKLILSNNSFSGTLPPSLGRLLHLQLLDLRNNSFHGRIPTSLSYCTHLQYLALSTNFFSGFIPAEFSSLTNLKALVLHRNRLTGPFPSFVGNLTSLQGISMAENMVYGVIPDVFHRLKKLRILALGSNHLSGYVPLSVYNLSSLTVFSLSFNSFHGRLPSGFGLHFPLLEVLELDQNLFSGAIPSSLSNASHLQLISMASNRFSGRFFVDFSTMQNLTSITLGNNTLGTSTFTEEAIDMSFISTLTNCSNLVRVSVESNNFKGKLPSSMANFSSPIRFLALSRNEITGTIPPWITSISTLTLFSISDNRFTGTIPPAIAALHKLQILDLSCNFFTGEIPSSLSNITSLSELYLYQNQLQGAIPPALGHCTYVQALDLSQNKLTGSIPKQLLQPFTLILLNLSHNAIIGPIPSEIGNLRSLWELDLSKNNMSGEIPTTLGHCTSLQTLTMKENQFEGSLPSSLNSLKSIQILDFSHNILKGRIPEFLSTTMEFLQLLDLSFNRLEGVVPTKGVFTNISAISLYGNKDLCGGIPELHLHKCQPEESESEPEGRRRRRAAVPPPAFLIIVCILSIFILLLPLVLPIRPQKNQEENTEPLELKKVSYAMLHRATDGFSSENLIGKGSFGWVYRGVMEGGGEGEETMNVAVKVLDLHRRGAGRSFKAECDAVRNTRHRNLVRMITSCSSIDYKGKEFKALVSKLMEGGSLEKWLHSPGNEDGRRLGFMERVNAAIDVASAIEYLHHHCKPPLIHHDLKPSNVLLDCDMTACVGDFGLAKFGGRKMTTGESSSVGAFGTVGYSPPEYGLGNEGSTSGDVYSFGIVILEMLTGKRPTDVIFEGDFNIHKYVEEALPHKVEDVVDPLLLDEHTTPDLFDTKTECLLSLFNIGITCSAEFPQDRKDMTTVLRELHSIKDTLKKTRIRPRLSTNM